MFYHMSAAFCLDYDKNKVVIVNLNEEDTLCFCWHFKVQLLLRPLFAVNKFAVAFAS